MTRLVGTLLLVAMTLSLGLTGAVAENVDATTQTDVEGDETTTASDCTGTDCVIECQAMRCCLLGKSGGFWCFEITFARALDT